MSHGIAVRRPDSLRKNVTDGLRRERPALLLFAHRVRALWLWMRSNCALIDVDVTLLE